MAVSIWSNQAWISAGGCPTGAGCGDRTGSRGRETSSSIGRTFRAYSSGSVVNNNGKSRLRAMSVASVAFSSATSHVKTATTQAPR